MKQLIITLFTLLATFGAVADEIPVPVITYTCTDYYALIEAYSIDDEEYGAWHVSLYVNGTQVSNPYVFYLDEEEHILHVTANNRGSKAWVTITCPPAKKSYNLSLDQSNAVIYPGSFVTLNATVTPDEEYTPQVNWSSTDPSIATVDDGVVTGVSTGEADIIASVLNVTAICHIKVKEYHVELNTYEATMLNGEQMQLVANVTPQDDDTPSVKWSSSRPGVVGVNDYGMLRAYAVGEADITAIAGNDTAICHIKVNPVMAQAIKLNQNEIVMDWADIFGLEAYVYPSNVDNPNVLWWIPDNDAILTMCVDNVCGITAMTVSEETEVMIIVSTTDGSNLHDSCRVIVKPPFVRVQSISVTPNRLWMEVGEEAQLTATVLPLDATNKVVSWATNNDEVAIVSNDGIVTAIKPGSAKITVMTTDGSNLKVSCDVVVTSSGGHDEELRGDVNGDGEVNIADVNAIIDLILSDKSDKIGDVNEDGEVNIADINAVIDIILNNQ